MTRFRSAAAIAATLLLFVLAAPVTGTAQKRIDRSVTVVLKDGHQKTFSIQDGSSIEFKNDAMLITHDGRQESIPAADVLRIDFNSSASKAAPLGRNHFVGKWEFGEGSGGGTFTVTLDPDGEAHKSIGPPHGTWVVVDGEARISWDDGWHDVIRKVGDKHEKFAYEPGKPLSGEPSNVSTAKTLNDRPM